MKKNIVKAYTLAIDEDAMPPSDYHINVFSSEEDGGYIADIPDLKHCSAFGKTPQAALREVLRAKQAWLRSAKQARVKIPKPTYRPENYLAAS